ncbi:hypothetical protein POPTR_001G231004v4 [Populus trichocarpa]|uniref:Uncharacterized protein n=1 Tax=Populus trichocarpa TaxID=3694 RepID=A0ACC0TLU6_POPTR|nr:hypothetical protein POPTR_001G231004v4 [Populus trichocarpa]
MLLCAEILDLQRKIRFSSIAILAVWLCCAARHCDGQEDCSSFSASALVPPTPPAAAANLDSHGFEDDKTSTES